MFLRMFLFVPGVKSLLLVCGSQEPSLDHLLPLSAKLFAGLKNAVLAFLQTMSHYMPPIKTETCYVDHDGLELRDPPGSPS